jgi:septum formation protein
MILLGSVKIGKPSDLSHAKQILQHLSGKTHHILTGLAMLNTKTGEDDQHLEKVDVTMKPFSEEEIIRYLSIGESLDKAGAYSLQGEGRSLIRSLTGDYLAAVGLPLKPIAQTLRKAGWVFPLNVDRLYSEKAFMNWSSF